MNLRYKIELNSGKNFMIYGEYHVLNHFSCCHEFYYKRKVIAIIPESIVKSIKAIFD